MSFLKRIIKKRDAVEDAGSKTSPLPAGTAAQPQSANHGVQAMSMDLQRKFARGVQFNMKIVIRGDKNVGKTALFYRLQGLPFKEEYIPTDEIQVASIHWNYKATDDIVKVEVWDVVDKGRKKKTVDSLKLDHDAASSNDEPCLDASFVDVYKGTHAVIFVFDMTKQWTYKYVEREVPLVPAHIPIIVLANYRDMGQHRTVDSDTVHYFLANVERNADAGRAGYAEASMLNGFGLKYLHKFFNIPYLKLQRDALSKQLEVNMEETAAVQEELEALEESEERNYHLFVALGEQRRKEAKESAAEQKRAWNGSASAQSSGGALPAPAAPRQVALQQVSPVSNRVGTDYTASERPPSAEGTQRDGTAPSGAASKASGFMARLFNKKPSQESSATIQVTESAAVPSALPTGADIGPATTKVLHVDDFVPSEDAGSALDFLEDDTTPPGKKLPTRDPKKTKDIAVPQRAQPQVQQSGSISDSDDDGGAARTNPMVAGFQDELDSSDNETASAAPFKPLASAALDLSSDDESPLQMVPPPLLQSAQPVTESSRTSHQVVPSPFKIAEAGTSKNQVSHDVVVALSSSSDESDLEQPSAARETSQAGVTAAGNSKIKVGGPSLSSSDEDVGAANGMVILADEDIADFPADPMPELQAVTITSADLDFLANITSSSKASETKSVDSTPKASKKKKKSNSERTEKEGSSKKEQSKKHKSRSNVNQSATLQPVGHAALPAAKESRKLPQKKLPSGEAGDGKSSAALTSEVDALEAFLSG